MPNSSIRIERKRGDGPHDAAALRKVLLQKHLLDVTPADAAAASGLPLQHCNEALMLLARRFHARVRVNEAGTLRFTFKTLQRPPVASWQKQKRAQFRAWRRRHAVLLRAMGAGLLAPPLLFGLAFNALGCYEAQMLGAHVTNTVMIGACLFAGLSFTLGLLVVTFNPVVCLAETLFFGLVIGPLQAWLWWGFRLGGYLLLCRISTKIGEQIRPEYLRHRDELAGRRAFDAVAFANMAQDGVRGFLFGPPSEAHDALTEERRLTAFIVRQAGVVTLGDLMGLFGWELETAMAQLPRLLLDYGGELVVTEEGALMCRFDALGADAAHGTLVADLRPFHLREARRPHFWGCPLWAVVAAFVAIAIGVTGLVVDPGLSLFPVPSTWAREASEDGMRAYIQGFGLYAYLFALLPLLGRLPGWLKRLHSFQAERGLRETLDVLVESPEGRLLGAIDKRAIVQLQGEIDVDRSAGKQVWVWFPREVAARTVAAEWRLKPHEVDNGVAFDTGA